MARLCVLILPSDAWTEGSYPIYRGGVPPSLTKTQKEFCLLCEKNKREGEVWCVVERKREEKGEKWRKKRKRKRGRYYGDFKYPVFTR